MLDVKNISKTFNAGTVNEKVALNGLSLHLDEGDFVTVIGGNGAADCGVPVAAVLYGYGSREELLPFEPCFAAQTCEQLADFILGQGAND